ncbi:MAG: helix-hairpin-helix domain-containing protein [Thermoproteota archaeon]|nr:helix-hairpin-helix domain-containing protein [Thermoproteota archaeon]
MRVEYILYVVAIICFILTVFAYGYPEPLGITDATKNVAMTVLFILGLAFIVAGYSQKPKPSPTPRPLEYPPTTTELAPPEKTTVSIPSHVVPSFKPSIDLTKVRGIGSKRAEKLTSAGILTVNDLVKATPRELAEKANTSTKVTRKWIKRARKLLEKT